MSQQILSFYPAITQGMELYKMSQCIQSPATHNWDIFDIPAVLMELVESWKMSKYLGKCSQFVMFPFCPYQAKLPTQKLNFILHHTSTF